MDDLASRTAEVMSRTAGWTGADLMRIGVAPLPVDPGSPATGGLWRVSADERRWFVKLIRHPRHWPGAAHLPGHIREHFLATFPWRFELDMALSPIAALLPEPLRVAELAHHEHADDDHVWAWWEWVDQRPGRWSVVEYAAVAHALGRVAARRAVGTAAAADTVIVPELGPGEALRYFVEGRVRMVDLPTITDATWWQQPAVVGVLADLQAGAGLRARLVDAAAAIGMIMDRLTALPQTLAHGDAGVQNLLITGRETVAGPEVVVIDWGFGGPLPIGFDLSQLLVSGVHAGLMPAAEIGALDRVITEAYVAGLAAEGAAYRIEDVVEGHHGGLLLRSGFSSLPADATSVPPEVLAERLRLTAAILDLTAGVARVRP